VSTKPLVGDLTFGGREKSRDTEGMNLCRYPSLFKSDSAGIKIKLDIIRCATCIKPYAPFTARIRI
jgi:hypothetical protein